MKVVSAVKEKNAVEQTSLGNYNQSPQEQLFFRRIYAENPTICNILNRYGLLDRNNNYPYIEENNQLYMISSHDKQLYNDPHNNKSTYNNQSYSLNQQPYKNQSSHSNQLIYKNQPCYNNQSNDIIQLPRDSRLPYNNQPPYNSSLPYSNQPTYNIGQSYEDQFQYGSLYNNNITKTSAKDTGSDKRSTEFDIDSQNVKGEKKEHTANHKKNKSGESNSLKIANLINHNHINQTKQNTYTQTDTMQNDITNHEIGYIQSGITNETGYKQNGITNHETGYKHNARTIHESSNKQNNEEYKKDERNTNNINMLSRDSLAASIIGSSHRQKNRSATLPNTLERENIVEDKKTNLIIVKTKHDSTLEVKEEDIQNTPDATPDSVCNENNNAGVISDVFIELNNTGGKQDVSVLENKKTKETVSLIDKLKGINKRKTLGLDLINKRLTIKRHSSDITSNASPFNQRYRPLRSLTNSESCLKIYRCAELDIRPIGTVQEEDTANQVQLSEETISKCSECGKVFQPEKTLATNQDFCPKCNKERSVRKEAIIELIETEVNYGNDLRILKDEFYTPIKINVFCTQDELNQIFTNLQELLDVNSKLCQNLEDELVLCKEKQDSFYDDFPIGEIFLNNIQYFEAYEIFCGKQKQSVDLLNQLENKSHLLRVFLQESCKENTKLRKMDIKSFLTMPTQRIMKYPLLLHLIHKNTARSSYDRDNISLAIMKLEDEIKRINNITKTSTQIHKTLTTLSPRLNSLDVIKAKKFISQYLKWKEENIKVILQNNRFEITSQGFYKKNFRVTIYLCVYDTSENYLEHFLDTTPYNYNHKYIHTKEAFLVIFKEENIDKWVVYKSPIDLKYAVVSIDQQSKELYMSIIDSEVFKLYGKYENEVKEMKGKLDFVIKTLNSKWRQRRNAMSNIMIQTMK